MPLGPDSAQSGAALGPLLGLVVAAALALGLAFPFLHAFYFLMTLPWRRRERAAMLLDLLELGRRDGRSPEQTLASLMDIPDRQLPVRLHLLAAHLETGRSLDQALEQVPHLLPPNIRALLGVGLRYGPPERVFALCRQALITRLGPDRSGLIYLSLIFTFVGLAGLQSLLMFRVIIQPKLMQILADLSGDTSSFDWLRQCLDASAWSLGASLVFGAGLYLALFTHVGGPRILGLAGLTDRLRLLVPWQRDRIHRDFAGMFGLLLDAGVPERVAVEEAARATGNRVIAAHAAEVVHRLGQGETLPQAIRHLDGAGEFRWRLANAQHGSFGAGGSRFTETLRGWLRALEARANQHESNAIQAVLCGMLLSFGVAVGLHCVGVFGWLVTIVEASL